MSRCQLCTGHGSQPPCHIRPLTCRPPVLVKGRAKKMNGARWEDARYPVPRGEIPWEFGNAGRGYRTRGPQRRPRPKAPGTGRAPLPRHVTSGAPLPTLAARQSAGTYCACSVRRLGTPTSARDSWGRGRRKGGGGEGEKETTGTSAEVIVSAGRAVRKRGWMVPTALR